MALASPPPPPPLLLPRAPSDPLLRLHALFLPVPRLLLKALEIAGNGRIWLPVPISLLLLSAMPASSGQISPLLVSLVAGLVLDLTLVSLVKVFVATDMYVAVLVPSGNSSRAFLVAAPPPLRRDSPPLWRSRGQGADPGSTSPTSHGPRSSLTPGLAGEFEADDLPPSGVAGADERGFRALAGALRRWLAESAPVVGPSDVER